MSTWDDFQVVSELQEQNQNLLLQIDAKDRELRELQSTFAKLQGSGVLNVLFKWMIIFTHSDAICLVSSMG